MNRLEWAFSSIFNSARRNKILESEELLVWGTGEYGESFARIAKLLDCKILSYMDSNKDKQGTEFFGHIISEPEFALSEHVDVRVVVAMSDDKAAPVLRKLRSEGRLAFSIKEFILKQCKDYEILEIGPLHSPFFVGRNIRYMDVLSADELREKAKFHHLSTDKVPHHIDYVSADGSLNNIKEKFDFVYSSHLIEHQTDLIRHLQEVYDHVKPGGGYVLAIPDKRYCFNYFDPCTTLEDVLAAYYEKRRRHSLQALLRAAYCTHNDNNLHWQGEHGSQGIRSRGRLDEVAQMYFNSLNNKYIDAHEWYFTPECFIAIMNELCQLGYIDFSKITVEETPPGTDTFFANFTK